ncbi:PadR family transcriptional regulator [Acetobacter aceti 1023]|nr:PadR family transcriptional regulator [Acetobacter aceti 1023]
MKHRNKHAGGRNRQVFSPEGATGSEGKHRHHHGRKEGRRGGRSRLFDYGEIRLLVLKLISEKPTYGYELIKDIEEKFGGSYTPSPGVIYPTLTWLEEAGYIRPSEGESRKNYQITTEGEAYLTANRAGLDEILSRAAAVEPEGRGGRKNIPMPVLRAMENLKMALRLRLRNGGLDPEAEEKIAALLDEAARGVGQV